MAAETTPSGALRLILVAHDRQLLGVECDEVRARLERANAWIQVAERARFGPGA